MRTESSLILCITLLCFCGCCPLTTPFDHYRPHGHADTTICISPTDDAILFNATGSGGRDLFLLRLADRTIVRIADTPDYEVAPAFSPDGKQIVYAAGMPGDRADHIFTIGRDGQSRAQLTDSDANDMSPRFSPDGSQIVFSRDKTYHWGDATANWSYGGVICVINKDGGGELQLTPDDVFAHTPSFSPDGKSVIYSTRNGLFSVPADGSAKPTRIGPVTRPVNFSPDGKQIVYSHGKYSPDVELFIANTDGTNKSQITSSLNCCDHGVFDSSGKTVYFLMEEWTGESNSVPKSSIWKVNTDGTDQTQVTDVSLFDDPTKWKP